MLSLNTRLCLLAPPLPRPCRCFTDRTGLGAGLVLAAGFISFSIGTKSHSVKSDSISKASNFSITGKIIASIISLLGFCRSTSSKIVYTSLSASSSNLALSVPAASNTRRNAAPSVAFSSSHSR